MYGSGTLAVPHSYNLAMNPDTKLVTNLFNLALALLLVAALLALQDLR